MLSNLSLLKSMFHGIALLYLYQMVARYQIE